MATFRKRGGVWQVQIRRSGFPSLNRTFSTKTAASQWAREQERAADWEGVPTSSASQGKLYLRDLLDRYEAEIVYRKRGARQEIYKVRLLARSPLGALSLSKVSSSAIAAYRDRRLDEVSPGTVRRELAILRHCLEVARREWAIPLGRNPVGGIQLPSPGAPRDRRLSEEDAERLKAALRSARAWYLSPVIELAVETGMRRGELLSLRRSRTDFSRRLTWLPITKSGRSRHVPLSPRAVEILMKLPGGADEFFPISQVAFRQAWDRLIKRAGVSNLRFHDLRHEAISRFFEMGLSVPEVTLISGHKDARMLFRYTHLRAEDVASKLHRITESRDGPEE
jgi:integrase